MNKEYLDLAIDYAKQAFDCNEVPIGAVIVKDNKVIGYGYNQKENKQSVVEHAEIIAIKMAEQTLNNWRLNDCDIYVSLDPCPMCASAIKQARIKNVYSAVSNLDENNLKIITNIFTKDHTNPEVEFKTNLSVDKSKELLNKFFEKQRNN